MTQWIKQHKFNGGEQDPLLLTRDDFEGHFKAASKVRNLFCLPLGAVTRRPGKRMVAEVPAAAAGARLAAFLFSAAQKYLFLFTDGELRVFHDDALAATETTPWTAAQVADLNWTQQVDTFLGFHTDVEYRRIMRGATHADWTVDTLPLRNLPGYHFGFATAGTLTPAAVSGNSVNFTSTATDFATAQVGWTVRVNGGLGRIKTVTSDTVVVVKVLQELIDTDPAGPGEWFLEEPMYSAARGWPATARFHKNRLGLGGGSRPTTIAMSTARDVYDFDLGEALDDDGVTFTLLGDSVDDVLQIASSRNNLLAFTSAGEWAVVTDTITPKTPGATAYTRFGIKNIRPVQLEEGIIFVGAADDGGESQILETLWNEIEGGYNTQPLSLLAQHLIRQPRALAARTGDGQTRANHVFAVNGADGTYAVLNTLRKQEVTGWSLCSTQGTVLDVAVVGTTPYFLVKRTIDAVDRYFVEVLDTAHYLDCSIRQTSGTAKTTWTGFDHLDGATVQVRADGARLPDVTVADGTIETPYAVSELEAGFGFSWELELMPPTFSDAQGAADGRKKRVAELTVNMRDSAGVMVDGRPIPGWRFGPSTLDAPVPLFTGTKRMTLLGWTLAPQTRLHGDDPMPVTLTDVTQKVAA